LGEPEVVLEFVPRLREDELRDLVVEVIREKGLAHVEEIRRELARMGQLVSNDALARMLRRLVEEGRVYEVVQRIFSTTRDVSVDDIARKIEELGIRRFPWSISGKTLYRAMRRGDKIVLIPNR